MGVLSQVLAQHLVGSMREAQAARAMTRNQNLLQGLMGQAGSGAYGPSGVHPRDAHLVNPPGQAGTGLMADPWDPTRQLAFAAGLMASPELANVGGSIFNQVLGQGGQDRRFSMAQDLDRAQFDMAEQGRMERHRQDLEQRRELHQESLGSREALALLQRQADERARLQGGPGNVQAGYSRTWYDGPNGPVPVDTPNPGTKEHNAAMSKMQTNTSAIQVVDELIGLVSGAGKEGWGPKSGRMAQLHGQLVSQLGSLRGMGVLEAGEYARMEEQLSNPAEMGFTQAPTILEQLSTVRGLFGRDLANDRRRFAFYQGMDDLLGWDVGEAGSTTPPPGTVELSETEAAALPGGPGGRTSVTSPVGARRPGRAPSGWQPLPEPGVTRMPLAPDLTY